MPGKKICVFIDAANVIYGCNDTGWKQFSFYELLQKFGYLHRSLASVIIGIYEEGRICSRRILSYL